MTGRSEIYRYEAGVLPIGRLLGDEPALVGVDTDECVVGGVTGEPGSGKTELALVQLAHVALVEQAGALFIDSDATAIGRIKPYLTGVADRVVELDLTRGVDTTHVAWNLLSTEGLEQVEARASAVVEGFAAGAGWSARTDPRLLGILDSAVRSLLYAGLRLPAELQPTIFTLTRLLTDETWRNATLSCLPDDLVRFWTTTYTALPRDAAGPLCQLLERLRSNPVVEATFGSPQSTYDPRRAMDDQQIVLACPPRDQARLVSSLVMFGHIDAARSRRDIPAGERPIAYWWVDGALVDLTRGSAAVVEQARKLGLRTVWIRAQSTRGASDDLWAVSQPSRPAASLGAAGEDWVAVAGGMDGPWPWSYVLQRPYGVGLAGVPLHEFWEADGHPDPVDDLNDSIDLACRPRTVRQTLALIEGHGDRILEAL